MRLHLLVSAHPNCVAFITHCGVASVLESIFHRVPMLGIPIVSDQMDNGAALQDRGLGLKLDKSGLTAELLLDSLDQIISNNR